MSRPCSEPPAPRRPRRVVAHAKGGSHLSRYLEVGRDANERYPDALAVAANPDEGIAALGPAVPAQAQLRAASPTPLPGLTS